jgi:hypothetical protein
MFFRTIGLSLGFASLFAFAMATMTLPQNAQAETSAQTKRQDRLVPAGGFKAAQQNFGYGVDAAQRG